MSPRVPEAKMKISDRKFWLKESRRWTADCVKLVGLGDWPTQGTTPGHPGIPPTEAGVYAKCAASDYFKAYPAAREVSRYEH
jgi:hypothetical protein